MSPSPLERALDALARLTWRRPVAVLLALAVVTLGLGWLASGLRLDTSFMGVLDERDPAMARFAEVARRFPAASSVVLVLTEGEEHQRRDAALAAAEALATVDAVASATARVDGEIAGELGLITLSDEDIARLQGALEALPPQGEAEPGLISLLTGLADGLAARRPTGETDPEAVLAGLDALVGLLERLAGLPRAPLALEDLLPGGALEPAPGAGPGGLFLRDGFLASADGEVYAVDLRTTLDPLAVEIGAEGFAALEQAVDPVRVAFPTVTMRFAGLLPGAYQDQQNVLGKVLPLSTVTLALVLLALVVLDRGPLTSLIVGICLVVSMIWTLGLVRLIFGYASLMVAACAIMLFGLGVDFAVHLVVRFKDERAAGRAGEEAMALAVGRTGRGVVVGGLTTVIAFALMALTDFKAATHLGVAAALGLGCALLLMLTALPALLRLTEGLPGRGRTTALNLPLLDRLVRACLANPRAVLLAAGLVSAAALWQLPRFTLETDLQKIITRDLPALAAAEDLSRAFGGSAEAILSVSEDLETARRRAEALAALPQVARVDGLHRLIPADLERRLARNRALLPPLDALGALTPPPRQALDPVAVQAQLARLRTLGLKLRLEARAAGMPELARRGEALEAAARRAHAAAEGQGEALAATEAALFQGLSEGASRLRRAAAIERFGVEDLPAEVRERYVSDGQLLTLIYPRDYRIQFDALREFKAAVTAIDPQATGPLLVVDQLLVGGLDKLPRALAAILVALILILGWDLRDPRRVAIALVPLALGSAVGVALVIALGLPVSALMLAAMPLIFGIGIDDGVHILHRWAEGEADVAAAVAATGKAILFTSLTTAMGFSILLLVDHNGLTGMSLLVLMGVGTCFLSSVTLLPVLASRLGR